MSKFLIAGVGVGLVSGVAFAEPIDFIQATTLSWTSDGPTTRSAPVAQNVTPDTAPDITTPVVGEDRITLGDSGDNSWYIMPNAGINLLGDFNDNDLEITYATGYTVGLSIGKEINPGFRMQLDIAYMKNDLDSIFINRAGGVSVDTDGAEITQTSFVLNAIWEPRGHDRLFPHFGLGVGAIKGDYSVAQLPIAFSDILDVSWAFALQVKAGFTFEISHSSELTVGYQFLHAHYDSDLDLNNNLVTLGMEFRF
ncbi:MAG: outer membrane beta-barrel protein [Phycisphaerales bacterium]|jgi:opacity protein-like surface antigen|nr:outer membrane beta-barrel protein [Phycisphaerales bacterium]